MESMYSSLENYFVEGPLSEYETFKKSYLSKTFGLNTDIKLAINCAVSFYHSHEHIFYNVDKMEENFGTPKKFYEDFILKRCPQFSLLRDITDCSKHNTLSRKNAEISSASQLYQFIACHLHEDEDGFFFSTEKRIYAKTNNGEEINLYKLLTGTRYFLLVLMFELGLLEKKPTMPDLEKKDPPKRIKADGASMMDMIAMQHQKVGISFKLFYGSPEVQKKVQALKKPLTLNIFSGDKFEVVENIKLIDV